MSIILLGTKITFSHPPPQMVANYFSFRTGLWCRCFGHFYFRDHGWVNRAAWSQCAHLLGHRVCCALWEGSSPSALSLHCLIRIPSKRCWNRLFQQTLWVNSFWNLISIFPSHPKLHWKPPEKEAEARSSEGGFSHFPMPWRAGPAQTGKGIRGPFRQHVPAVHKDPLHILPLYILLSISPGLYGPWSQLCPRPQAPSTGQTSLPFSSSVKQSRDTIISPNSFKIPADRNKHGFTDRSYSEIRGHRVSSAILGVRECKKHWFYSSYILHTEWGARRVSIFPVHSGKWIP